jgi:hypothetical protein
MLDSQLKKKLIETFHRHTLIVLLKGLPPPPRGGERGVLHLFVAQSISFKARVGKETNHLSEMLALKLVLMLSQEHGVTHMQIFEDLLLVIKWMRHDLASRNFTL